MDTSARTALPRTPAGKAASGVALRFPEANGRRSTTATCRGIVADAARAADAGLARGIETGEHWHSDYAQALRVITALAADPERALAIARAGIESMRGRLIVEREGTDVAAAEAFDTPVAAPRLGTGELRGAGAPVAQLEVPYRGRVLRGEALLEQLGSWVASGTIERSCAEAVTLVAEHPEWLSLAGRTVTLIGAGSEIGPLRPLCSWGADVIALDVPAPAVWERISTVARSGSGSVRMPVAEDGSPGLDVVAELDETRAWLAAAYCSESTPVLGMYAYADAGAHVLLSAAFDLLAADLCERCPSTALAWLATPTDAYLPPPADVERARAAYRGRRLRRFAQAPAQLLSGGRLYRPAYPDGEPVADALIQQQGPNYAVAKRLQRWCGLLAREAGQQISFNVAPATLTRSVTKNRVLASAYGGAGLFGIEIFAPETTRVLMAALLVHDLNTEPAAAPGEQLFSAGAAHGGLWTAAYEPRSALPLAAIAGLPATLLEARRREGVR